MSEPTDYERGLRDGVEIGRCQRPGKAINDAFWWVFLFASGALLGLAVS